MQTTGIEYLTHTWNPIAMRCSRVSEGCRNCWHLRMADRMKGMLSLSPHKVRAYAGIEGPYLDENMLSKPLRSRAANAIIGVQFMGDLFHEDVPNGFIREVWQVMTNAQQHTFIVLTKRPERMLRWYTRIWEREPLPNVWLGVSVENLATAKERIPLLLQTPAACRLVSLEPMLEPVNLDLCYKCQADPDQCSEHNKLDWVIMGCESGPGARPMNIEWARSVKDQCVAAGVPLFYKQGPGHDGYFCGMPMLDGHIWAQRPEKGTN